jgi:hypothetical protein
MNRRWVLVVACVLLVVWLIVRLRPSHSAHVQTQVSGTSPTQAPNVYLGLRSLVLQGTRANFGLVPGSKPTQPFAVVMDWGISEGSSTVVAIADGSASVYLSNGSGFIGGGQTHQSIRNAALKTVGLADEVQPLMHPTTAYPLAPRGQVNFYVVADAGVFTATATEDDLRSHRSPFSNLGDSAQNIVSEYRRIPPRQ